MDKKRNSVAVTTASVNKKKNNNLNIESSTFISYKKNIITKEYSLGRPIHKSTTSDIRSATHKETNQKRAVRIIKKNKILESKFFQAVDILPKLNHPNILQTFEFFEDNKSYYIVTDICHGGELIDQICEKGAFTEKNSA